MMNSIRPLLIVVVVLFAVGSANGQDTLKFADLGDFKLGNGQFIRDCRIGYRTFGELNQDQSNAVLITTFLTGTTADLTDQIGPGKMLDSSNYFVIAVDAFGNGVSSSPSNSKLQPGEAFPTFTIRDMVNAQHQFLTQELKLTHLYAVTGISMGGMQTFQWMVSYPEFMDKAIPIQGTPRQTSYDLIFWQTQLGIIEANRDCENGESHAMQAVVAMTTLALQTPSFMVAHVKPEEAASFMAAQEKRWGSLNINDYASQLRAMLDLDVYKPFGGSAEKAAAAVKARVLVIVTEQDHVVNPTPAQEFARLLKAESLVLSSDCGHVAAMCEKDKVIAAVRAFLEK